MFDDEPGPFMVDSRMDDCFQGGQFVAVGKNRGR